LTTEQYFAHATEPAPPSFDAAFDSLIARRRAREPFAYLVGHQEFWGLRIDVSPAVLIPRPETELLVEAACEASPDPLAAASIADVGTGSGCVAIAIARERPRAAIIATDISDAALDVARGNAARLDVEDRITFRRTDLLDGVGERFDLVVSNPPYVRAGDRLGLQPEVQLEPAAALYAGPDGLALIRRLAPQAADRLKPGGLLIFEFGYGQEEAATAVVASTPDLTLVTVREDFQTIPRVAIARRR
jgi:release factor glutamine methyltransferase